MQFSFERAYDPGMSRKLYSLVRVFDKRLGYHVWQETHPDACANGHDWTRLGTVSPGWYACAEHDGHRTWRCRTAGCDAPEFFDPPHDGAKPVERWEPTGG
jgi:hypothetical protein